MIIVEKRKREKWNCSYYWISWKTNSVCFGRM